MLQEKKSPETSWVSEGYWRKTSKKKKKRESCWTPRRSLHTWMKLKILLYLKLSEFKQPKVKRVFSLYGLCIHRVMACVCWMPIRGRRRFSWGEIMQVDAQKMSEHWHSFAQVFWLFWWLYGRMTLRHQPDIPDQLCIKAGGAVFKAPECSYRSAWCHESIWSH